MKTVDSAFNASFARAMAKRNAPERPEENNGYAIMPRTSKTQIPGTHRPESKTAIIARVVYTKAIQDYINDTRSR
jgi:hypothetical protein